MARRKRAEIAKAQAESEGMNGTTNGLVSTKIGENGEEDMTPRQLEDPEQSIGFATLFSGDFSIGDEVWVLPPKFNPAYPHAEPIPKKVPVKALYLLMGRGLEPLQLVLAVVCSVSKVLRDTSSRQAHCVRSLKVASILQVSTISASRSLELH